jgi:hypothetical protein
MADSLQTKQAYPATATLTDLYTVPASTQTLVKGLLACNQGASAALVRVSIAIAGAADTPAQYLAYGVPLESHESKQLVPDTLALATTDVLRVQSDTGYVSFVASILEVT